MRFRFPFLVILLFLSAPSFAESKDDLVYRDGLFYKKFTDVPFTGELDEGLSRGSIKNGHRVGPWIVYHDNGQLFTKGLYNENGEKEGLWVSYWDNGQLWDKGEFKNGMMKGYWESYERDGSISNFMTGTWKNGKKISD